MDVIPIWELAEAVGRSIRRVRSWQAAAIRTVVAIDLRNLVPGGEHWMAWHAAADVAAHILEWG